MPRIAYVNGRYVPHRGAAVHIEDRGYQFADGVYEVIAVQGGRLVDLEPHLRRLGRSLGELAIAPPMSDAALRHVLAEVRRRNHVRDGMVYLQVTRGIAPRDHAWPKGLKPAIVVTAKSTKGPPAEAREKGVRVLSMPDLRWKRCDIKTTSLLPNVLAKQAARDGAAFEALFVDDAGRVTEGSSTNVWIVTKKGRLLTRPPDAAILNGITRQAVIALAREAGFAFEERSFTLREAKTAAEAFLTSTTAFIVPIVVIDGTRIGDGTPGQLTRRLNARYRNYVARAVRADDRRHAL
ncbi:MAG: D-amino-acid transaminase [Alphaproteobacteria bacterium]